MTAGAQIRSAAEAVLAGDETGYRTVLELGYDAVVRGVLRAYRTHARDKEHEAEDALTKFVCDKLDRPFLEHLARADEPLGLLFRSAQNYAIQRLRRGTPPPPPDPEPDPWELEPSGDAEDARAVLAALTVEQRALIHVFFVERAPADREVVEWIARRRGVDRPVVEAELHARARAIELARGAATEEIESRYAQLLRLEARHAMVCRVVREVDGSPVPPEAALDRRLSALRTELDVRTATAGERSALLLKLEESIETQRRLQTEAASKANDPLAKSPDYEEVARILGVIGPSASAAERRTAVNTVTVKIRRLRRQVAKQRVARACDG